MRPKSHTQLLKGEPRRQELTSLESASTPLSIGVTWYDELPYFPSINIDDMAIAIKQRAHRDTCTHPIAVAYLN